MILQFHRILRWLLFLWVKVEVYPRENPPYDLDQNARTLYVLADRGLSDLLVLTQICRRLSLPSPLQRISIPGGTYYHSVYSLASSSPLTDWLHRRRKQSPLLQDFIDTLQLGEPFDVQVVPVSVFWGRPLAKQKHWIQVLFADTWSVGGRISKFLTILVHGRNTRLLFSQPVKFSALARDCDYSEDRVHDFLVDQLSRQREATFGPEITTHQILTNAVLKSEEVQSVIRADADKRSSEASIKWNQHV